MAYFIAVLKGIVATLSNVSLARDVQTAQLILLLALVLWVLSAMVGNPDPFHLFGRY